MDYFALALLFLWPVVLGSESGINVSAPDIHRLYSAEHIQDVLLKKFQDCDPMFASMKRILFSEVKIVGWPSSVIFASPFSMNSVDRRIILQKLNQIHFIRDYRQYEEPDPKGKKSLFTRLSAATKGDRTVPWDIIKRAFPDFHLSTGIPFYWTGKDCFQIEKVLTFYEKDQRKFLQLVLQERMITLEAHLLQKYCSAIGQFSKRIDWNQVKVTGWPQGVVFCNKRDWTTIDALILHRSINEIVFEPVNSVKQLNLASYLHLRSMFLDRFLKDNKIDWNAVILHCPGIHLSSQSPAEWTASDFAQIQEFFAEEIAQKSSVLGKRGGDEIDESK